MFKDIYKRANDKIDTQSAKSRVIAKLNKPVPVKRHYPVAKIAALAACFVLTIAIAGVYERVQKDISPAPMPQVSEKATDALQSAPISEEMQKYAEQDAAKPAPKAVKKENTMPAENDFEKEADVADKIADENPPVAEIAETLDEKQAGLVINNGLDEQMAYAVRAMSDKNEKEVPVSEYCEYLGKNIPEVVSAVVDMTDETTDVQMLEVDEAGEYVDDSYEFLFTKEDKILKIETTKQADKIKEKIESSDLLKSKIGETDAVVMAENEIMKAYFATEKIGYTITSVNCEEILVEELLFSLN